MSAPSPRARTVAAIDLGSNSFRLVVARHEPDGFAVVHRHKERIRLAAGLDTQGRLGADVQARALACLERMAPHVAGLPPQDVRAVGTSTLRTAVSVGAFLARAAQVLGHPVRVISGDEEARLVYRGVVRDSAPAGPRMVVDVGGGSTELAHGTGAEAAGVGSLPLGCVGWTQRFFGDGRVDPAGFGRAQAAARQRLAPVAAVHRLGPEAVLIGTGGTVRAVGRVLARNGLDTAGISAAGLGRLR